MKSVYVFTTSRKFEMSQNHVKTRTATTTLQNVFACLFSSGILLAALLCRVHLFSGQPKLEYLISYHTSCSHRAVLPLWQSSLKLDVQMLLWQGTIIILDKEQLFCCDVCKEQVSSSSSSWIPILPALLFLWGSHPISVRNLRTHFVRTETIMRRNCVRVGFQMPLPIL